MPHHLYGSDLVYDEFGGRSSERPRDNRERGCICQISGQPKEEAVYCGDVKR